MDKVQSRDVKNTIRNSFSKMGRFERRVEHLVFTGCTPESLKGKDSMKLNCNASDPRTGEDYNFIVEMTHDSMDVKVKKK